MDGWLLTDETREFLSALEYVCVPDKKMAYYVDKLLKNSNDPDEVEKIRVSLVVEYQMNKRHLRGAAFGRLRKFFETCGQFHDREYFYEDFDES